MRIKFLAGILLSATLTMQLWAEKEDRLLYADFDNYRLDALYSGGNPQPAIYGTPAFKPGKHGSSAYFTQDNWIEFSGAGNILQEKGTIEFWFKFDRDAAHNTGRRHMITIFKNNDERLHIRESVPGGIYVFVMNKKPILNIGVEYGIDNEWHHLAFVWGREKSETSIALYIDGKLKKKKKWQEQLPDFSQSKIIVGASQLSGLFPMNGMIDDLKIFRNVRYTEDEYPEFSTNSNFGKFAEDFAKLKKDFASLDEKEKNCGIEKLLQETDSLMQGYEKSSSTEKHKRFQQIRSNVQKLNSFLISRLWWRNKEKTPFAAIPLTCMKKVDESWESLPDKQIFSPINSASGEWQSFQVILLPGTEKQDNIKVEASSLIDSKNGSVIPAADIQIFKVASVMAGEKRFAEKLYELKGPVDLSVDKIQPLWVLIKIPRQQQKGRYDGKITLSNSSHKIEVPYQVNVYGFSLPLKPRFKTTFGFAGSWMASFYGMKSEKEITPMLDKYLANMLAHKISPKSLFRNTVWNAGDRYFLHPKLIRKKDGSWKLDFKDYDRQLDKLIPLGFNNILIGYRSWNGYKGVRSIPFFDELSGKEDILRLPILSKETELLSKQIIREWFQHMKERGLAEMCFALPYDEPPPRERPVLNTFCKWIHEAAPGLLCVTTAEPAELCPYVDIWCPLINLTKGFHNGKDWMYVCCSPLSPSPNFFVQQSALQNRLPFWFAAKHGAQGFLYYETGRSMALNSTLSWGGFPGTYGDGIFVYPGPEGPINTNRLEYIRMGIQDVEYFLLLKSLISSMPENSELYMEAKKLLSVDESLIKSSVSYCSDWNAFAEKKHSIGLLIEKILNDKK